MSVVSLCEEGRDAKRCKVIWAVDESALAVSITLALNPSPVQEHARVLIYLRVPIFYVFFFNPPTLCSVASPAQNKNQEFLVGQQGPVGADIETLGPWGRLRVLILD